MRSIVVLATLALLLAACEPDYITADRLEPFEAAQIITEAKDEILTAPLAHDSHMADLHARLSSSEEKISFDLTRAKRQLVGNTHHQRHDINVLIDSHAHTALSEVARARTRIDRFDAEARAAYLEEVRRLENLDAPTREQTETIIQAARDAFANDELDEWVNNAESSSIRAAESIQNELNRIRTSP